MTSTLVQALAVSGNIVYAGSYGQGVFLSTDNGSNWVTINDGLISNGYLNGQAIWSLTVSGSDIFAGTENGVFLLTNNTTSWTQINNGIESSSLMKLRSIANAGTAVFAGTYGGGIYFSSNYGSNWTPADDGLPGSYPWIFAVAFSGTNIFAGGSGGVWKRPLSELVGVSKEVNDLPKDFTLSQNYPNPFNPGTTIKYSLAKEGHVKLTVYNEIGCIAATILDEHKPAGNYSVQFNGSNLASGIYLYRLKSGNYSAAKKLLLIK